MEEIMINRIDSYLLDRMTAAERKRFEDDLKTDEALNRQYRFMKMMKQTLKERNDLQCNMNKWDREMQSAARHNRKWLWIGSAVAAALVAVAIVPPFFMGSSNSPEDMVAKSTVRGDDICFDSPQDHANASSSAAGLDDAFDMTYVTTTCSNAKAIKQSLEEGDYNTTLCQLDVAIRASKTQGERDSLTWVKVEVLLENGQVDQARPLLQHFVAQKGVFAQSADSLLNNLPKE